MFTAQMVTSHRLTYGSKRKSAPRKIELKRSVPAQDQFAEGEGTHPIDTLLVRQIEELRQTEATLRARYATIEVSDDTVEVRMAFTKELADLASRADRLYRLVDAMDFYGPQAGDELAICTAVA